MILSFVCAIINETELRHELRDREASLEILMQKLANTLNANNGYPYSDLYNSYTTNGIKRVKDATTFTWTGALTNTYTPTATSKPKITIKFDVTNMLKSSQQAANACFMWIESPSVSVAVSD